MIYFDNLDIEKYAKAEIVKPLSQCSETIRLYEKENRSKNPYRKLAERFKKYEENINNTYEKDGNDWYFYKYLKSLGDDNDNNYKFPLENGDYVTVTIDLFKPYLNIDGIDVVDPRWHYLVSWFAYIDAANNHKDNEYAKEIADITSKPSTNIRCNSLNEWKNECRMP